MSKIDLLLVVEDRTLRDLLEEQLQLNPGVNITRADSWAKAVEFTGREYRVVVYAPLPETSAFEIDEVLDDVRLRQPKAEVILILPAAKPELEAAAVGRPEPKVTVLHHGTQLRVHLTSRVVRIQTAVKPFSKRLSLAVTVQESNAWIWRMEGKNFNYRASGILAVEPGLIAGFERRSVALYHQMSLAAATGELSPRGEAKWRPEMQELGIAMRREIFEANLEFWSAFTEALREINTDYRRLKVNFQTGSKAPILAYEAVFRQEPAGFWVVEAPMSRSTLGYFGRQQPLFAGRARSTDELLNCLLIESDAEGDAKWPDHRTERLRRLKLVECEAIRAYLTAHRDEYGLGRIVTISRKLVGGNNFRDYVEGMLKDEAWHLIHYAGHSFYRPEEGKGYLFFPTSSTSSEPVPIEVDAFAALLTDARFVYLSSCQSAAGSFVQPLARFGVPALIGFSCAVSDVHASEFAVEFYKELFHEVNALKGIDEDERRLEHALSRVRSKFFNKSAEHPMWAQAIMMMEWL